MDYTPPPAPGEGSAESVEARQHRRSDSGGTGRVSHSSVKEKVAALERSSPIDGSPGVMQTHQSQDTTPSRGIWRSKSKRGDDPMPRQVSNQQTTSPRERIVPDAQYDPISLDGCDDVSRRLELLEARSRSKMDADMTASEANRFDLVELISKQKWKFVLRRVEEKPAEARMKYEMMLGGTEGQEPIETRALPIHKALCLKPPLNVVESMLAAYPESVKVTDERWGRLPIHMALLSNANAQILKLLVVSLPTSVQIAEKKDGRVPLHLACLFGSPYEVSLLLTAHEYSIDARDRYGKTPLELAFESTNCHREAIIARLQTKKSKNNSSTTQRSKPNTLQQPGMHMEGSGSVVPLESPDVTNLHNKAKSVKWKWQKKDEVPVLGLPDLENEGELTVQRNRATRSFSMNMAPSDDISLQPSSSGDGSSRSFFRRSRARSMGHGPRPRSTSRERGFLSRFGKSRARDKKTAAQKHQNPNDFKKIHTNGLDDKNETDDRTVASMPAIFPYSPSTKIAQFSTQYQETPRTGRNGNNLSRFLEQTTSDETAMVDRREAADVHSLPSLPSEKKIEKKRQDEGPLGRIDSAQSREHGSAFHQVAPRNDADLDLPPYMATPVGTSVADLSLVGSNDSTEIAANLLPSASPASAHTFLNESSTSSDQHVNSLSEDLASSDEGEAERSLESIKNHSISRHWSTVADNKSELTALESQLRHLDVRKEALVEECNHVSETILSKREQADKARRRIQTYQQKIAGLRVKIEKEQASLEAAESRMQLHLETLEDHQAKLKTVQSEMRVLQSIKESLAGGS
jgi:hypothetical protein